MSKLNVDQKTIKDLLQDKKADFLIPDYQRPYSWGEKECLTLWDDIFLSQYRTGTLCNLTAAVNIFWDRSSHLKMTTGRWK